MKPLSCISKRSDEVKESFLAHHVRVTQAPFNIEEKLLGVSIDLTQREFVIVPHELQIIEGGGIDVGRSHLAEFLRYSNGGERL